MQKIVNYEFIEVVVPAGATASRYFFPDQPQLRFVSLLNLESYCGANGSGTMYSILSGAEVINLPDYINAYLVLYYNDKESVNRLPLQQLNRTFVNQGASSNSVFQTYPFAGQQIIWAKSYVQFSVAPTQVSTNPMSIPLGVYWA